MSIQKVTELSLFNYETQETLNELELPLANAEMLYTNNFLSFNPAQKIELNEIEYHELLFCGSLFVSGLSLSSIANILSKLEKPYSYNIYSSYYDFRKKE